MCCAIPFKKKSYKKLKEAQTVHLKQERKPGGLNENLPNLTSLFCYHNYSKDHASQDLANPNEAN